MYGVNKDGSACGEVETPRSSIFIYANTPGDTSLHIISIKYLLTSLTVTKETVLTAYKMYSLLLTPLHYLCKAQALDIGSIDFHNSIPWLQGVALLPVPDSFHDSHPASWTARHHAEAEASFSFTLGQGHWHQLPCAQAAHAHHPRGGQTAGTGSRAGVALETVEATVLGAVGGWRTSEV